MCTINFSPLASVDEEETLLGARAARRAEQRGMRVGFDTASTTEKLSLNGKSRRNSHLQLKESHLALRHSSGCR